jgi:Cdc6-like AAA superfamily ATPase
MRDT